MLFKTILTLSRWTSAEGYHTKRSLSVFILVVFFQLHYFLLFNANYLHLEHVFFTCASFQHARITVVYLFQRSRKLDHQHVRQNGNFPVRLTTEALTCFSPGTPWNVCSFFSTITRVSAAVLESYSPTHCEWPVIVMLILSLLSWSQRGYSEKVVVVARWLGDPWCDYLRD